MSTTLKIALLSTAFSLITMTTAVASDLVRHDPSVSETTETNIISCPFVTAEELESENELSKLPNGVFTDMLEMIWEGTEALDKTSLKKFEVHEDLLKEKDLSFRTASAFGKFLMDVIDNIKAHKETISNLTEEIGALKEQIASKESSSSESDRKLNAQLHEKQRQYEETFQELQTAVTDKDKVLTRLKTLENEHQTLRQKLADVAAATSIIDHPLFQSRLNDLDNTLAMIDTLNERIRAVENDNETLKTESQRLHTEKQIAYEKIAMIDVEKQDLKLENQELILKLKSAEEKIQQLLSGSVQTDLPLKKRKINRVFQQDVENVSIFSGDDEWEELDTLSESLNSDIPHSTEEYDIIESDVSVPDEDTVNQADDLRQVPNHV